MEGERIAENNKRVEAAVKEVKEAGGVDSSTFWKVKKKLMGGPKNDVCAIMDEEGTKQEDVEKVKEVYQKYFTKLLRTEPGTTEEEKRTEVNVEHVIQKMEALSRITKPI